MLSKSVDDLQQRLGLRRFVGNPTSIYESGQQYPVFASQQLTQNIRYDLYNFTWTNNSPVAGRIAWSQGQLIYKGITYDIAAGNSGVLGVYVYWQLASPYVFSAVATTGLIPALGADDFLIAVNNGGVYERVFWEVHDSTGASIFFTHAAAPAFKNLKSATATAGAGGALPATVEAYLNCYIDGAAMRIPYYKP